MTQMNVACRMDDAGRAHEHPTNSSIQSLVHAVQMGVASKEQLAIADSGG